MNINNYCSASMQAFNLTYRRNLPGSQSATPPPPPPPPIIKVVEGGEVGEVGEVGGYGELMNQIIKYSLTQWLIIDTLCIGQSCPIPIVNSHI